MRVFSNYRGAAKGCADVGKPTAASQDYIEIDPAKGQTVSGDIKAD